MKDYWFRIKVSDLLLNPGQKDYLEFDEKYIEWEEYLSWLPISWKVEVQSLDHNTLAVTLVEIKTKKTEQCEKCWNDFEREIIINNYFAKYINPQSQEENKDKTDEDFEIEMRDETIDIKDMVIQSILIDKPLVISCNKCELLNTNEDDENLEHFESKNTIKWIK